MNMKNEIILRSAYGKVQQTYFINPCPNPRTGRYPDCVKPVKGPIDATEMILSEDDITQMSAGLKHFIPADKIFEIVDGTSFNLDDIVDKANWEAIENSNWIAKDRFQKDAEGNFIIDGNAKRYGVADLYVERPGEIARIRVDKKTKIHKANTYIYDDSESDRIKKAKVLGRNLSNANTADVLDYLLSISEKTPDKIINLYEGEDWKMHLFVLDAVDRGVIRKADGIFKYDDKMLGGTIEATIITLRDIRFKKLLDSIKRETYPNLMTKSEIEELQGEITEGIPHFNEPETVKKTTKK